MGVCLHVNVLLLCNYLFYHDVNRIWFADLIQLLKLGHVTGQGSIASTWVGWVYDPGKKAFIKGVKMCNIAVCLITCLKSKWKKKHKENITMPGHDKCSCLCYRGNLQSNSWCCQMIIWKVMLLSLNPDFTIFNKQPWVMIMMKISSKILVCLQWGIWTCANNLICIFKYHVIKTFRLILISFQTITMDVLLRILMKCMAGR